MLRPDAPQADRLTAVSNQEGQCLPEGGPGEVLTFRTSTPSPQTAPATGREMSGTSLFCPTIRLPQVRASVTGTGHWWLCQEAAGVVDSHTGIQCLLGHLLVGQLRQSTHLTKLAASSAKWGEGTTNTQLLGDPMHCSPGRAQSRGALCIVHRGGQREAAVMPAPEGYSRAGRQGQYCYFIDRKLGSEREVTCLVTEPLGEEARTCECGMWSLQCPQAVTALHGTAPNSQSKPSTRATRRARSEERCRKKPPQNLVKANCHGKSEKGPEF